MRKAKPLASTDMQIFICMGQCVRMCMHASAYYTRARAHTHTHTHTHRKGYISPNITADFLPASWLVLIAARRNHSLDAVFCVVCEDAWLPLCARGAPLFSFKREWVQVSI